MTQWPHYLLLSCTVAISLLCVAELARSVCKNSQNQSSRTESSDGKAGRTFRMWFLAFLSLSNLSRVAFLALEAFVYKTQNVTAWWNEFLFILPSMLFFSSISIVLSFWSQCISSAKMSNSGAAEDQERSTRGFCNALFFPVSGIRSGFIVLNVLVYTALAGIAWNTYSSESSNLFMRYSMFFLGTCDFIATTLCIYYGQGVARNLYSVVTQTGFHRLLRKIVFLCVICTAIFFLRGVYCMAMSSEALSSTILSNIPPYVFHGIVFSLTEWLPSLLLVWVIRHPSRNAVNSRKFSAGKLGLWQSFIGSNSPSEDAEYPCIDRSDSIGSIDSFDDECSYSDFASESYQDQIWKSRKLASLADIESKNDFIDEA